MLENLIFLYLATINITGFVCMGLDKRWAVARHARIPERRLMAIALFGGSIGAILGMTLFRHKTRHKKFVLGLPTILLLQMLLAVMAVVFVQGMP